MNPDRKFNALEKNIGRAFGLGGYIKKHNIENKLHRDQAGGSLVHLGKAFGLGHAFDDRKRVGPQTAAGLHRIANELGRTDTKITQGVKDLKQAYKRGRQAGGRKRKARK